MISTKRLSAYRLFFSNKHILISFTSGLITGQVKSTLSLLIKRELYSVEILVTTIY